MRGQAEQWRPRGEKPLAAREKHVDFSRHPGLYAVGFWRGSPDWKGEYVMKLIVKSLAGALAATMAMTTHAAAQVCILGICLGGGGGGGGGGGTPEAPEINVAQGFAALAILACAALFLRERFLRQR